MELTRSQPASETAASRPAPPRDAVRARTLRFHHLHYRVADPGAALGDAADAFKGTRVILQGLGVGVRVDRQYVLFDRLDPDSSSSRGPKPADAYAEAVRWLTAKGVRVAPPSLADTAVARTIPDATLAHVAFAADDPRTVMAALGATPVSVTDDRAWFRLRSGVIVEIVRDTDRPDAFWCPMHPDVRSPGRGELPRFAPWRSCPSRRLASASTSSTSRSCPEPVAGHPDSRSRSAIPRPAIR